MDNQTLKQTKGLGDKLRELRDLFTPKKKKDALVPPPHSDSNPENRREGETYLQWGTRICGIVTGSLNALPPYLQKVYNHIYNEQVENVELQETARKNIQSQIDRKNAEINDINEKIANENLTIDGYNKKRDALKEQEKKIWASKEQVNKEQKLKLILGLIIILPLTFYLFLFYSSTFYSAFFRNPESVDNVMNAMFDSNAIVNAYHDGFTEIGFVLSAPIIFLGLGFVLHFFSVQKDNIKYLKMASILLVTVMFDCILAYLIGKLLHSLGIMTGQYPIGEQYTVSMAFNDINTWAVIFCGFIVYIIWGLVFSMIMSAYDKMDLNKTRLENIKQEVENLEQLVKKQQDKISNLKTDEKGLKKDVDDLMSQLGSKVYIDYSAIRTEMTNFFAGWIKMMEVLSIDKPTQDQASEIYEKQMTMLIPK